MVWAGKSFSVSLTSAAVLGSNISTKVSGKSLAQPTSQCILFDGENISFDVTLVIYIHI
jgi:hypothetical protein